MGPLSKETPCPVVGSNRTSPVFSSEVNPGMQKYLFCSHVDGASVGRKLAVPCHTICPLVALIPARVTRGFFFWFPAGRTSSTMLPSEIGVSATPGVTPSPE